ncbi:transposase [Cylindrospermopsis curvispora]|uniref:Transposase n=1 Tax=Cylindrospermopsis curvispora GIHE-G1 TaxID=2666332 RepID=A0A7H0F4M9_9CYAN|nr:transposase [Cylindrospermopsis curvispora]QNP30995.1 transposase [Cylindrospermopsis curvispora GIHE-G1]
MFLDESGINLGMSRLFARSQDGQRAIGSVPGNKGKNISLIGALNMDGILAAMTKHKYRSISHLCKSGFGTSIMERGYCCYG